MGDLNSDILLRYCNGLCTKEEQEKVKALLGEAAESAESDEHLVDLKSALELGRDIKRIESVDVAQFYQKTWETIRERRMRRMKNQLTKYAAIFALPLFLTSVTLGYLHFGKSNEVVRYAEVVASKGTVIRYELPDKSIVWLNAGSKLSYPVSFDSEKREVSLEGEAFFEVQSDKAHPFYVNTPKGLQVYVYGTKFNISAYEEDDNIETTLESGRVNVILPNKKETIELAPSEQLSFNYRNHQFTKATVDVYEKIAWKDGKLIFRNETLEEVLKKLARHFNVDIQFQNRSGKEYKYRATFRNETLPQILDYLSQSAVMKWKVEESVQQQDGTLTKKKIIVELYE